MKFCPVCGTEYAEEVKFCPRDGHTTRSFDPAADPVGRGGAAPHDSQFSRQVPASAALRWIREATRLAPANVYYQHALQTLSATLH